MIPASEAVIASARFSSSWRNESKALDACALLIPRVGFLPYDDERVVSTVETISKDLTEGGFVLRYRTDESDDGLSGHEGSFLICSFWLVNALWGIGRRQEAEELFERLLDPRNDVGLLSEEYDARAERLVGNLPQTLTHLGLVDSALVLSDGQQTGWLPRTFCSGTCQRTCQNRLRKEKRAEERRGSARSVAGDPPRLGATPKMLEGPQAESVPGAQEVGESLNPTSRGAE